MARMQELPGLLIDKYKNEREAFQNLMANPAEINRRLEEGEARARVIARDVLGRVRKKLGFDA